MKTVNILGIEVINSTLLDSVDLAVPRLEKGERTFIVTPNAEMFQEAVENPEFMAILKEADMALPDGSGVVLAAKRIGTPLKTKIAGVDFGEEICRRLSKMPETLFIYGGKEDVARKAALNLMNKYKGLKVADVCHGYVKNNESVLLRIKASGASVMFVCLGSPAQEKWIRNNIDKLPNIKLVIGLGGSVDIYANTVKRAPQFMIAMKAEWLYRLIKQPSRIGRMMRIPKFLKSVKAWSAANAR